MEPAPLNNAGKPSLTLFAAQTLVERLAALRKHVEPGRASHNAQAVHQLRVASRRLRAALGAFDDVLPAKSARRWRQDTKRLTKALGEVRDLDVQIEWLDGVLEATPSTKLRTGLRRLRLRLLQQRQTHQPRVVKELDRLENAPVLAQMPDELHGLTVKARMNGGRPDDPALQDFARPRIERALEEMLAYDSVAGQPHLTEQLHQLRIAAKRLRYTMELFKPLYADALEKPIKHARKLQAALGNVHDMDVWIDWLPTFLEAERHRTRVFQGHLRGFKRIATGIEHLREHCIGQRERAYEQFIAQWRRRAEKGTWDKLRRTLADPPQPNAPQEPGAPDDAPIAEPEPNAEVEIEVQPHRPLPGSHRFDPAHRETDPQPASTPHQDANRPRDREITDN